MKKVKKKPARMRHPLTDYVKQMYGLECGVCGKSQCVVSAKDANEAAHELADAYGWQVAVDGDALCYECVDFDEGDLSNEEDDDEMPLDDE